MKYEFDFAKVDVNCEAEADRILNCYVRYMLKKFNLRNFDHSIYLSCPKYSNYHSHIKGLLLKANQNLHYKINHIFYPSCNCKELDILARRFLLNKYKVKLKIDNRNINRINNILDKDYQLTFIDFIRDIIFELRQRKGNNKINKKNHKNDFNSKVLLLGHDLNTEREAYLNLFEKLNLFFKNQNKKLELINPSYIGLSFEDKLINSFFIFRKLFSQLITFKYLKLSDIQFIILHFYREIYKRKLKNYFIKNNIKTIISVFIDNKYEPVYYEAAKELKIKYCIYDYSLGYPMKYTKFSRYLLDTRKYCDVIFSNSDFRSEYYSFSCKFMNNPPLIKPHISPQSDYAISKENKNHLFKNNLKVGLIDNVVFDDCAINHRDVKTLIEILVNNPLDLRYILQSKRGFLENELKKQNICKDNFISGEKGDFSNLSQADLIISLGWQSTALYASSCFKKPLVFYSKNGFPYENHNFSFKEDKNKIMIKLCKNLWLNKKNLNTKINEFFKNNGNKNFFITNSEMLLDQIGFHQNSIEEYFRENF